MVLALFIIVTLVWDLPTAAGSKLSQEAAEENLILGTLQHLPQVGLELACQVYA